MGPNLHNFLSASLIRSKPCFSLELEASIELCLKQQTRQEIPNEFPVFNLIESEGGAISYWRRVVGAVCWRGV